MGSAQTTVGDSRRRVTDTEWLGDLGRWVVSARLDTDWTLVGLFSESRDALDAARVAAGRLAPAEEAVPRDEG
jgi:hypothetical protein